MAEEVEYFTQEDWSSEHLPEITWQEMLGRHMVLSPSILIAVLGDAKDFLLTADGPHLFERNEYVPSWFNFWRDLLLPHAQIAEDLVDNQFVGHLGVRQLDEVAVYVASREGESGSQNMGGGEGTKGHLASYEYMRKVLGRPSTVVWAFEQDSYFAKHKSRPLPLLDLPIRLSMAIHLGVNVVTVYPESPVSEEAEVLNSHYLKLFRQLGVGYSFADELDPYAEAKSRRGKTDRDTIIPHLKVPSTSDRVSKMFGDINEYKMDKYVRWDEDEFDW